MPRDESLHRPSAHARPLIENLKRALRREGITYARLAKALQLSEASIKRLFSQGRFSLHQVLAICDVLGTTLGEVARTTEARAEGVPELGVAQERALADDARLLLVFHLVVAGWSAADVAREYGIAGTERTLLLAKLDRLKLIELLPGDRVKLRVARDFRWRDNGPVRRRYGAQVLQEFLQDRFAGERALLRFEVRELSDASIQVIRRKLERTAHEVAELAELDAGLPAERRKSVGVALALRPWVFSLAQALQDEMEKTRKRRAP